MTDDSSTQTQIHHHYSKPHITSWIEAGCAIVLIFITSFYTCYASHQADASKKSADAATKAASIADATLKEIQKGGADTHTLAVQAKNQADATKQVADNALIQARATNDLARQARRSATIAQNTLQAEYRPWIGYDHANFSEKVVAGSSAKNTLFIRNWGKGPAVNVHILYAGNVYCGEFPKRPEYYITQKESTLTLMPNQVVESGDVSFTTPLTQSLLDIAKSPNCGLYFFSRILYADMNGRQHWRHWCGKWAAGTDNSFQTCSFYNDGDENYPNGKEP